MLGDILHSLQNVHVPTLVVFPRLKSDERLVHHHDVPRVFYCLGYLTFISQLKHRWEHWFLLLHSCPATRRFEFGGYLTWIFFVNLSHLLLPSSKGLVPWVVGMLVRLIYCQYCLAKWKEVLFLLLAELKLKQFKFVVQTHVQFPCLGLLRFLLLLLPSGRLIQSSVKILRRFFRLWVVLPTIGSSGWINFVQSVPLVAADALTSMLVDWLDDLERLVLLGFLVGLLL